MTRMDWEKARRQEKLPGRTVLPPVVREPRRTINRYGGPCHRCGRTVPAGKGRRILLGIADQKRWVTVHHDCSRLTSDDSQTCQTAGSGTSLTFRQNEN